MQERPDINTNRSHEPRLDGEYTARPDGRSFKQLLQDIVSHVSDILRSEVRLAKAEIREDITHYCKASTFIALAGVLMFYAGGLILLSCVYALEGVMPSWLAALAVSVAVGVVAAILYKMGRKKLKHANLRPEKTIQSLGDNVTWFKKQTR